MELINNIMTEGYVDKIYRSDGTIYTFDHSEKTDEYGAVTHTCKGYLMSDSEYSELCDGKLPNNIQWDDMLHRMFRQYQHERADDMYVYAQRMFRATQDSKYSDYITALDQWNAQVSATASTYSTDIPDMPTLE